mgnify:CR=1 FL=1
MGVERECRTKWGWEDEMEGRRGEREEAETIAAAEKGRM